jgi:DNA polymerase
MDVFRSAILHELGIGPRWLLRKPDSPQTFAVMEQRVDASVNDVSHGFNAPSTDFSMEGLRQSLLDCFACSARSTSMLPLLGRGSLRPKVLLIGESIDLSESEANSVYIGEEGDLLEKMLNSIGLSLSADVYACKSIRCNPGTEIINQDELNLYATTCGHFLRKIVDLLQPQLILCLGRNASISLMGIDFSQSAKRSQVYDYQGIPLLMSLPPDILLMRPKYKQQSWKDLCLLKSILTK